MTYRSEVYVKDVLDVIDPKRRKFSPVSEAELAGRKLFVTVSPAGYGNFTGTGVIVELEGSPPRLALAVLNIGRSIPKAVMLYGYKLTNAQKEALSLVAEWAVAEWRLKNALTRIIR